MPDVDASSQLVQILLAEAADKLAEKIRPIAETAGGYAESGPTFDPDGDYLCGTCALRLEPDKCASVSGKISMETGSCYSYYKGDQLYQKPLEHQFKQSDIGYSERPTEKGFGCKRCEYAEKAGAVDSAGRESYCNLWGMHIIQNACCFGNDSEDDVKAPGEKEMDAAGEALQQYYDETEVVPDLMGTYRPDLVPGLEELAGEYLDQLQAEALFHDVRIEGFTKPEEEYVRAGVSRIPPELLKWVTAIKADRGMGAKHGNYDTETNVIKLNPNNFRLRMRLGRGPGWMLHAETTMTHEIGHSVYEHLTDEQKQEWIKLGGWVKTDSDEGKDLAERYVEKRAGWPPYRSRWRHKTGVVFPRHYAEKNPDEAFADCFSFFSLGKPHQMSRQLRDFLQSIVQEKVRKYPQALIEGPSKAYGERGN